jgi:hypothetical protein
MPRWQRAYVIAMCALIGAPFAYAIHDWALWPSLIYLPVRGELVTVAPPDAVAIRYFGAVLWGIGGLASGALVGAAVCAIVRRPVSDRVLHLLGAWAITAIALAGGYWTWTTWPR